MGHTKAFTPGPWTVRCARIFGAKNRPVADVLQWATDQDAPSAYQSKANAALMAASPEMQARLERLHEYLLSIRALKAVTGPTIDAEISETRKILYVAQGLTGRIIPL